MTTTYAMNFLDTDLHVNVDAGVDLQPVIPLRRGKSKRSGNGRARPVCISPRGRSAPCRRGATLTLASPILLFGRWRGCSCCNHARIRCIVVALFFLQSEVLTAADDA